MTYAQNLSSAMLPVTRIADPADLPLVTDPGERRGDMLYRRFGRTGGDDIGDWDGRFPSRQERVD